MKCMGLEEKMRQELRRTRIREAVLMSLQTAGMLAMMVVVPNTLTLLNRKRTRGGSLNVRAAVQRLIDAGMISAKKENGRVFLQITNKGAAYINKESPIRPPKKWDKKWRVVVFDIPESRRPLRNSLRAHLVHIGFQRLQNSVWVFPYDCEELVILLKTEYRLGKEILYMIADHIEADSRLRKHFKLGV